MRITKLLAIAVFCLFAVCAAPAAKRRQQELALERAPFSEHDGLSIIAAALNLGGSRTATLDCSHLVHAIYERAGFVYPYARSSDLYSGIEAFQRVNAPQPGDLIVWHGHVGIVVNPAKHAFFSSLRSGLGVDDYQAPAWQKRGRARFYRYLAIRPAQNASTASSYFLRAGQKH